MSYLYVKWNSFRTEVYPPTCLSLEHGSVSLATPGTEAGDAVGGALRAQGTEWPATEF
jgi:hypothetical protein